MKIIRITTLLDFGGQERKYISFTNDKTLLKNEYYFAAIGYGGYAENLIRQRGFEVVIFNQNPRIKNLKNIWILFKWFRKIKPDVVHAAAAEANFHATIAAKLAGVKIVIAEEIGLPTHSSKAKLVFKYLYRLTDKVICVSKAVKQYLIEINEITANKGIIVYNPVSQPIFFNKIPSNKFTIVCIGRLEKVKNQQLLIRTFAKLDIDNLRLIIVGDGRERLNLETLIGTLELKDKVEITGFTSEPEKYLSQADLFVLPSLSEGFGIAVVEAMQQGLPCLCSNVGGIPEFIDDDKTGWLFNPNDENILLQKLNNIINLPKSKLNEIGKNAKKYISTGFTEKSYVKKLENLYQELHD